MWSAAHNMFIPAQMRWCHRNANAVQNEKKKCWKDVYFWAIFTAGKYALILLVFESKIHLFLKVMSEDIMIGYCSQTHTKADTCTIGVLKCEISICTQWFQPTPQQGLFVIIW